MDQTKKLKELDDYKKSLEDKSSEELHKMEDEIIAEADKVDKEVTDTKFKLPEEDYETVAKAIRMLLNKQKVRWQFTLGLLSMYDFWKDENPGEVAYPMLDSTLRTLGEMEFEGYEQWAAVVVINKYFEPIREEYVTVTEKVYDVASKHNAIMDRLKLVDPVESDEIPAEIKVADEATK